MDLITQEDDVRMKLPISGITVHGDVPLARGNMVVFSAPKYPWWIRWYTAVKIFYQLPAVPIPEEEVYRVVEVHAAHVVLERIQE